MGEDAFWINTGMSMRALINLVENEILPPEEDYELPEAHDRNKRLEASILELCKSIGLEFDSSFPVNYDDTANEIMISPVNEDITLSQLQHLAIMGAVSVSSSGGNYRMKIVIRPHHGLDIT